MYVEVVGFEPTHPNGNGFTDRCDSPTSPYFHVWNVVGLEPTISCVQNRRFIHLSYTPILLRRGRDSNPRSFYTLRFSRPVQQTTLPPLLTILKILLVLEHFLIVSSYRQLSLDSALLLSLNPLDHLQHHHVH